MASSPCRATEGRWTLGSLVGTYLDLALAYLCLCAAAVAFLAAKFLGIFGVSLPCSCGGQAVRGRLHRHHHSCRHGPGSVCLQTLLLDYPTAKIAGAHASLRRRFPFDTLCHDCRRRLSASCCCSSGSGPYEVKLVNDDDSSEDEGGGRGRGRGRRTRPLLAMGDVGEESCGSVAKPSRASGSLLSLSAIASGGGQATELETSFKLGGSPVDVKGKGVLSTRPPSTLRHRRRGRNSLIIRAKSPPVQHSTPLQLGWRGEGATRDSVDISGQSHQVAWARSEQTAVTPVRHQNAGDHDELVGRAASAFEYNSEGKCSIPGEKIMLRSESNESSIVRDLKQALEEEQSARAALLLELEKERNSAATAAEEAMAMIFRLQEEKSGIEMEARQYRRMAEEKSAYDEEEMDILKEIIVRRERETHVLEKEIESYREMMLRNNGVPENDAKNEVHQIVEENNLFESSDDAELMLKEIYKSITKEKGEEKINYLDHCGTSATKENNLTTSSTSQLLLPDESVDISHLNHGPLQKKHQKVPYHRDECSMEEKGMVTVEDCASSLQIQRSAKESRSCMLNAPGENEVKGAEDTEIKMSDPLDYSNRKHNPNAAKINSEASPCDNEVSILDVHVIDDITAIGGQGKEKHLCLSQVDCASNTSHKYTTREQPFLPTMADHSPLEKLNIHRSCSDSTMGLSANSTRSYPVSTWLDLRRRSMSSVDSERFKLENEVENLRKRLKIIQEGRKKLNVSLGQREKEMYHLRVLEEISCQLNEIRKATETRKSTRRASLPPSSSKVTLKKRRSHSVSIEQQEST